MTYEIKTNFIKNIVKINNAYMKDFKRWSFHKGALFNSYDKWWADDKRITAHEGIDLCSFEDCSGTVKNLNNEIKVPAAFAGEIIKIEKDFLGESIYIKHDIRNFYEQSLYTLYGHLKPLKSLKDGVQDGAIIALISDGSDKIAPHIHISFAWISDNLTAADITWNNLNADPAITLIDPLSILKI